MLALPEIQAKQDGAGSQVRQKLMAASDLDGTWWVYVVLFFTVAASWAGVPAIGAATIGAAVVAASQHKLDITVVILVSVVAGEAGGLAGYAIGRRWGRRLMERPGRRQASRKKMEERGESVYARWGALAVFFTPSIISGTARMPLGRFAFWNLLSSFAWTASVVASIYGVSRLATGHASWQNILILIAGLAAAVLVIRIVVRRHRRHAAQHPAAVSDKPS